RRGRSETHRRVSRTIVHPGFDFDRRTLFDRVPVDLALVELERPILPRRIEPFPTEANPGADMDVTVVSFAKGRREFPSLQEVCRLFDIRREVLMMTCDVDRGASGAPVFYDGRVVSVISGMATVAGRRSAMAASLEPGLSELRAALERGEGIVAPTSRRLQRVVD
ncbi:MAG: trypsin-like serine peptidase, partial [Shimia sp.]